MNILVTLDSNYINPLKVMLKSLFVNNCDEDFCIYLIYSHLSDKELKGIESFVAQNGQTLEAIKISDEYFEGAPLVLGYKKEMYFRLLAYKLLPEKLDKILYLDPDILVINAINELYDTDIDGYLYAASYHNRIPIKEINRLRLKSYDLEEYFNSGVLLMNLALQRKQISENDIYEYVKQNKARLILPDQDIINSLYSKDIKAVEEILYNYDARYYRYYKFISKGKVNMDFVINNTSIIHFCGKRKPWAKSYSGEFLSLYKHYEKMALGKEPMPAYKRVKLLNFELFDLES